MLILLKRKIENPEFQGFSLNKNCRICISVTFKHMATAKMYQKDTNVSKLNQNDFHQC